MGLTEASLLLPFEIHRLQAVRRPPFVGPETLKEDGRTTPAERPAARILVVEDDWFVGMDAHDSLQEAGYEVLDVATSASEAIEAAGNHRPDLVIMDVRLVGPVDGVDAALEIARRFGIRCLFVTAFVEPALKKRAEPAHPTGWLTKPITNVDLVQAVADALKRGQQ